MHELSIAISLVEQVEEELRQCGGGSLAAVHLTLGMLSGVDRDALLFCYAAACEGTGLEGSRLIVDVVPVTIYCAACGIEGEPQSMQQLCCARCRLGGTIVRGQELEIASLELAA